jgi:uncharacterized RDD family membrane protein YckC
MRQRTPRETANQVAAPAEREQEAMPDAAGFWRRLVGFVVDWLLCFVLPSVVSSLLLLGIGYSTRSTLLDGLWMVFLAVVIFCYFTYFSLRGASPGMRVAGIKLVEVRTGKAPGLRRSLIRGALLTILIGSWFLLILLGWGGGSSNMSNVAAILLNVVYVLFLVSFFGHLWIAWDRKRQTLQDKLAGLIVLRRTATIEPDVRPARHIDPLEWRM